MKDYLKKKQHAKECYNYLASTGVAHKENYNLHETYHLIKKLKSVHLIRPLCYLVPKTGNQKMSVDICATRELQRNSHIFTIEPQDKFGSL